MKFDEILELIDYFLNDVGNASPYSRGLSIMHQIF